MHFGAQNLQFKFKIFQVPPCKHIEHQVNLHVAIVLQLTFPSTCWLPSIFLGSCFVHSPQTKGLFSHWTSILWVVLLSILIFTSGSVGYTIKVGRYIIYGLTQFGLTFTLQLTAACCLPCICTCTCVSGLTVGSFVGSFSGRLSSCSWSWGVVSGTLCCVTSSVTLSLRTFGVKGFISILTGISLHPVPRSLRFVGGKIEMRKRHPGSGGWLGNWFCLSQRLSWAISLSSWKIWTANRAFSMRNVPSLKILRYHVASPGIFSKRYLYQISDPKADPARPCRISDVLRFSACGWGRQLLAILYFWLAIQLKSKWSAVVDRNVLSGGFTLTTEH